MSVGLDCWRPRKDKRDHPGSDQPAPFSCSFPSRGWPWARRGSWPRRGAKRCRETPSSPGTHALPLRGMRWCPLCPQLFGIGPRGPRLPQGCPVLRHGEKPEVVSTSPSGQEAGLNTSQRTPAGICSSPPLGSGYSLIPREELSATHNSCRITRSIPNSWAADKI